MPAIRINKEGYILLQKQAIDEDRSITKVVSRLVIASLKPIPKGNPQLKEKKTHLSFQPIKDLYFEYWEKNNGFSYSGWGVVDASATNRLIKKLETLNKSDCSTAGFFQLIISRLPDFYKDKTINAINKNLDGIIAEIKSGGGKGKTLHQDGGIFDHRN